MENHRSPVVRAGADISCASTTQTWNDPAPDPVWIGSDFVREGKAEISMVLRRRRGSGVCVVDAIAPVPGLMRPRKDHGMSYVPSGD